MGKLEAILEAIHPVTVAQEVGIKHEQARANYHLRTVDIRTYEDFRSAIGDYYKHHFSACIAPGAFISTADAQGEAELAIRQGYQDLSLLSIFNKVRDMGEIRHMLDIISLVLKRRAMAHYISNVFATYIPRDDYSEKRNIIIELMNKYRSHFSKYMDYDHPDQYVNNYEQLIQGLVDAIEEKSDKFRGQ